MRKSMISTALIFSAVVISCGSQIDNSDLEDLISQDSPTRNNPTENEEPVSIETAEVIEESFEQVIAESEEITTDDTADTAITENPFLTIIVVNRPNSFMENSWERTMAFKGSEQVNIYEIAIWDSSWSETPDQVSLYNFSGGFEPTQERFMDGGPEWVEYRESFNVASISVPPACRQAQSDAYYECSEAFLDAFTQLFQTVYDQTQSEHYALRYHGHGSDGLFGNALSMDNSEELLASMNQILGRRLSFLDWSTNCSMGNTAVLSWQSDYTDYIVASDIRRGGFTADWAGSYRQLSSNHIIDTFFSPSKSIRQSLIDMLDSERMFWETEIARQDMTNKHIRQSLSLYDMSEYGELEETIESRDEFPTGDILSNLENTSDIEVFHATRIHYVSNKDFFNWDDDLNGLWHR